jgi:predicted nucleic acid-binding Zn ribbon protein
MKAIYHENMRQSEVSSLREAIDAYLSAYRLKDRYQEAGIVVSWADLMGAPIARYTKRIFIKEKTLFVEISSAPLKNELLMSKNQIIKILNQNAGGSLVEEVIFL